MSTKHFAVCVQNEGYEESPELRKIYEVLEEPEAAKDALVRVVDEDEDEDYLDPVAWFLPIKLPQNM